ncbi:hypothetical protein GIS00_15450 [Nakamurella sp. YIM 132087]|uniref:DUF5655 domain-containing protein n=1 Tax=Nakamurella alba TaxID=2665158 RepID=A0A7K1FMJ1_9ACTN|nr:DUF5655 domain-containing protein [Nakamurella alba]MTD15338.1 hypothetical protein [Nakamurella alba]
MAASTWSAFTKGLDQHDLALIRHYRDVCRALPGAEERVHTSQVQYARKRIFTSAYVKSHYLEIGLELLRTAEHPKLRTSFASSKKVTMHRITLRELDQFDDALVDLLRESCETVGPGLR